MLKDRIRKNESREEGRLEGHQEGRHEANIEMAKKLKKAGLMSIKEIADLTGLSIPEVEQL